MVGDRMVGSWSDVKWGSRAGNSDGVHEGAEPSKEPCPEGDRASVGARKRGNARGAKGGRDVADIERAVGRPTDVVPERAVRVRINDHPRRRSGDWWPDVRRRMLGALSPSALIWPSNGRSQEPSWSIAWKAGCGQSASPVWEGGGSIPPLPHLECRMRSSCRCRKRRSATNAYWA
jgi:hypothetical protein